MRLVGIRIKVVSVKIGEFIYSIAKERDIYVICGHRHTKCFLEIGNIKLYRSPVGYLDKSQNDYEKIAKEVIGKFDI
ncbi:hypothetical protein [Acetivibrio clariflavus]|uniref:hypothetical protein n=1 Tax=Acetivibrio clariflavus TaxID=288965 RepID=UPI0011A9BB2A|nr:hypothetical protein [Acetivibrio clariflavus]HOQ01536.1 hypothetical protein [Acetivibrio clariflavus]HPU42029.1 hypothetical protein [Acetivibrio clariflavus]